MLGVYLNASVGVAPRYLVSMVWSGILEIGAYGGGGGGGGWFSMCGRYPVVVLCCCSTEVWQLLSVLVVKLTSLVCSHLQVCALRLLLWVVKCDGVGSVRRSLV